MVVAQLGVRPDDALALLRAHAFALEIELDEVAEAVLTRRLDFSETDDDRNGSTHS
jgi:hypothetical protein